MGYKVFSRRGRAMDNEPLWLRIVLEPMEREGKDETVTSMMIRILDCQIWTKEVLERLTVCCVMWCFFATLLRKRSIKIFISLKCFSVEFWSFHLNVTLCWDWEKTSFYSGYQGYLSKEKILVIKEICIKY